MNREPSFLLAPYRVLDLSMGQAAFCGKILVDLGAEVIKLEKPGGDPYRKVGPFYKDIPDPEKSLFWFSYNAGKKSITLDIKAEKGQELLKRLVQKADVIIESFAAGYMDGLGLGYSELSKINPGLIMTSITPFGQDGPYRDYKATDIVVMALGGLMSQCGDPDRPPVRISFPQAFINAGADGAIGTLIALYYRELSGEGQHVDVSAQQRMTWMSHLAPWWWELLGVRAKRVGTGIFRHGGAVQRDIWPCKDGYVAVAIMGGHIGAASNRALVEWMDEEGMAPDFLKSMDWLQLDYGRISQEDYDRIGEPIETFLKNYTKAEIYSQALQRGIFLFPVSTVKDIVEDAQLAARSFWESVEYSEPDVFVKCPANFVKLSEGCCRPLRRSPFIGEHNALVYEEELGLSENELGVLKAEGVI